MSCHTVEKHSLLHFQNEQFNQIGGILRQVEHVDFN